MTRLDDAIILAVNAFEGQLDKKGGPAILHSLHVMSQMETESDRVIAMLHDVIEDTRYSMEDILDDIDLTADEQFVLHTLTHRKHEPYLDYIGRIKTAGDQAIRIKLVDIGHNMRWNRLDGLPEETVIRLIGKYIEASKILRE